MISPSIYRADYNRALRARLEETFYQPISRWCESHGVALTGHPAGPDDIGQLRYFQMPGQDIVWRYIEPGKASALEGAQSTQGKCASSAMIHLGQRRNLNEYCGAYGHNFTFEEMKWLTGWLIVRGCNLLVPHAFYYSVRGPRVDERPPDVGPNSAWWGQYKGFADACRRLCWLNTGSRHVCGVAILGLNDQLPWEAARIYFENQIDFNYLEARHLWEDAEVGEDGIRIAGMRYEALVVEVEVPQKAEAAVERLQRARRVIRWNKQMGENPLLSGIDGLVTRDVRVRPASRALRVRHVVKGGIDYYILFNEGQEAIEFVLDTARSGRRVLLRPDGAEQRAVGRTERLSMEPHELAVLAVTGDDK
jgi:hypothetical protein